MNKTKIENLTEIKNKSFNIGLYLMSLASIAGIMELPAHYIKEAVISPEIQHLAVVPVNKNVNNPLQREKEEVGVEYVSYSETQRTPSRAGKY